MELREKAKQLLEAGEIKAVLGFEPGTHGARRPAIARSAARAERLGFEGEQNLASYVTRREIKRLGRVAVAAKAPALRALLQLMAERQLKEGDVLPLVAGADGQVRELAGAEMAGTLREKMLVKV